MSKTKRCVLSALTGLGLALLLSACDSVGKGNQLVSIHIVPSTSVNTNEAARRVFTNVDTTQCVHSSLALIGQFSKSEDSLGTLTQRPGVHWSSSNQSVARVTNYQDTPVPGDTTGASFFPAGVITPIAPGITTITADFLDLTATMQVTVKAVTDLKIEPADATIAPNSSQVFRVTATIDGLTTDISTGGQATNTLPSFSPANDDVAAVISDASTTVTVVQGRSPGGPLNLQYSLPACGQTLSTTVRVADIQSLELAHEDGFDGNLVVGVTELYKVLANFAGGAKQDVSASATYALVDSTASTRLTVSTSSTPTATAIAAGDPVEVQATCCRRDINADGDYTDDGEAAAATSNKLAFKPVAGVLTSIALSPLDATIQQLSSQQYSALGTFDNGITQPVTRSTTFASSDNTIIGFSSGVAVSSSLVEAPTTITVTATPAVSGTTAPAVTTTLTVTPTAPAP